MPKNEDGPCQLSPEAAALLNGPHVPEGLTPAEVPAVVQSEVNDSYEQSSRPKFRLELFQGRFIEVEPDFFRKMFS